ncbi:MAG: hypothetical protein NUV60_03270 [Patescibacteria group bacterium]|nr:hypothetical protein [Patescibacteria group bacterium]
MGNRGAKPKGKVKIKWSANFAYAIGLLVSDGCLSGGRHVILVSKDIDQLQNFMKALVITVPIGKTKSGYNGNVSFKVQFSDVLFYNFLESIGLMPHKSKIIAEIKIPEEYFFDFLRGSFDGDGCTYSYWDPRWKSSFMFYTCFVSASRKHILWLRDEIDKRLKIKGHMTGDGTRAIFQLKYAKADSLTLLQKMYHSKKVLCLSRKRLKIVKMLATVEEKL